MILEFFLKGGIVMWPILLCSVLSVAVICERFIFMLRAGKRIELPGSIDEIKRLIGFGKKKEVLELCNENKGPLANIISAGIINDKAGFDEKQRAVSRVGSAEVRKLEKHLSVLALIGDIAPLLGLLGTVMGLIRAFMKVQELGGRVDAGQLAGGIWEALITTAAGLIVAIPTLAAYHYFEKRVGYYASYMKETAGELLDLTGIDSIEKEAVMESEEDDRI